MLHLLRYMRTPQINLPGVDSERWGSSANSVVLVSQIYSQNSSKNHTSFPVSLCWRMQSHPLQDLIDSGSDECCLDSSLEIPILPLETPLEATALNWHMHTHTLFLLVFKCLAITLKHCIPCYWFSCGPHCAWLSLANIALPPCQLVFRLHFWMEQILPFPLSQVCSVSLQSCSWNAQRLTWPV